MTQDIAYWLTLANLPKWGPKKTTGLIIQFFHEQKLPVEEFFRLDVDVWKKEYGLSPEDIKDLLNARSELANNAFLAESMLNEGYEVIPVTSPEYPSTLKDNLKSQTPVIIYIKGNTQILKERSVAIVGSRSASDKALTFTDNIAKLASQQYKVVVSGFAKGVDKQALDSTLKYKGQSIIVLPQGIMTFGTGFKTYYRQVVDGDLLVLSIFHPKAPWKVELAMARNPIIYGLAREIYVAESNEKGGTWYGVVDGLKKGRNIYVRKPEENEKNANEKLIGMGAIPVDFDGKALEGYSNPEARATITIANESEEKLPGRSKQPKTKSDPMQKGLFDE